MADRQTIVPDEMKGSFEQAHFAPAVRSGSQLFCSGQVGNGSDGKLDADPTTQIRTAFENVGRVLAEAGASFDDIDEMTTFHVGVLEHIATFMHVKDGFVKEPYPAWTAVGVTELAFGALVEIKVRQQLS